MKKIFVIIGHRNWGKTYTIRALINSDNVKKRTYETSITIRGKTFGLKHMSNDDLKDKEDFKKYLLSLDKLKERARKENFDGLILPICPVIDRDLNNVNAVISNLKKFGSIYFFILKNSYKGKKFIRKEEILVLEKYGKTFLLESDKPIEAKVRAIKLRKFIVDNL